MLRVSVGFGAGPSTVGAMKTVLVPIDFSPMTKDVVDTASAFARDLHGRVILMHVDPTASFRSPYPLSDEMRTKFIFEAWKAAEQQLEKFTEFFRQKGIPGPARAETGEAASPKGPDS